MHICRFAIHYERQPTADAARRLPRSGCAGMGDGQAVRHRVQHPPGTRVGLSADHRRGATGTMYYQRHRFLLFEVSSFLFSSLPFFPSSFTTPSCLFLSVSLRTSFPLFPHASIMRLPLSPYVSAAGLRVLSYTVRVVCRGLVSPKTEIPISEKMPSKTTLTIGFSRSATPSSL